jgi:CRISPR type IV-associated protein Csf3
MTDSTIEASSSHVPVMVTAHLAHGYATAHPWGLALDGILAAEIWHTMVADSEATDSAEELPRPGTTPNPPDLPLPLARCTPAAQPDLWHWAATCSQPVGAHRTEIHHRGRYLDHRAIEQLTRTVLPASLPSRSGPYRGRWMPLIVTVCSAVTWSAVGDPDQIRQLLTPIAAIGKKRSHGEGTVTRWDVSPNNWDPHDAAHLHLDGTLGRPCPPTCVADGSHRGAPVRAGLRPPYMHPSRQADLYLPSFLDDLGDPNADGRAVAR